MNELNMLTMKELDVLIFHHCDMSGYYVDDVESKKYHQGRAEYFKQVKKDRRDNHG